MKVLFEEDIEKSDFLEIALSKKEAEQLSEKGVVEDFPSGLHGTRNLNIFIRVDETLGDEDAIKIREKQESHFREYKRDEESGSSRSSIGSRCPVKRKRRKKES